MDIKYRAACGRRVLLLLGSGLLLALPFIASDKLCCTSNGGSGVKCIWSYYALHKRF